MGCITKRPEEMTATTSQPVGDISSRSRRMHHWQTTPDHDSDTDVDEIAAFTIPFAHVDTLQLHAKQCPPKRVAIKEMVFKLRQRLRYLVPVYFRSTQGDLCRPVISSRQSEICEIRSEDDLYALDYFLETWRDDVCDAYGSRR